MIKKLVVMIFCMLVLLTGCSCDILAEKNERVVFSEFRLLNTAVISSEVISTGDLNAISSSYFLDNLDQQQTIDAGYSWAISENGYYAQSFKPTLEWLTRVEVKAYKLGNPVGLKISIRDNLTSADLTSKYVLGSSIPTNAANRTWVEFDFPDIAVKLGSTSYIVWDPMGVPDLKNDTYWTVGTGNPYANGVAWIYLGTVWQIHNPVQSPDPDFCFKTYGLPGGNNPPNTPGNPNPSNGASDVDLNADVSWTGGDPDVNDTITYDVYFGSLLPVPKVASNISTLSYNPGTLAIGLTYYWNVVAWDNHGFSTVGLAWHFTTTNVVNNPPDKPVAPSGDTFGQVDVSHTYESSTTDSDGDQIYYLFDWGDGTDSGWIGTFESGDICQESHMWTTKGSYSIKVKAKDTAGLESPWSDPLPIKMPYSYNPILKFLELLFQRFPNAFPLLRQLLEY